MKRGELRGQLGIARLMALYYGVPGRFRWMRQLYRQFIKPGDLCFDIGAHVGSRLRVWTALGARIIAVEPQPQMMRWLKRRYGRKPHISFLPQAVGVRSGEATMNISRRTPTVTTLSTAWKAAVQRDPAFARVQWDTAVTVPVITLDEIVQLHGRPAFCKIDVEGYELAVLQGLSEPLPALSFEYTSSAMEIALDCIHRLGELGRYEFNYVRGEKHRWMSPSWLSPDQMTAVLKQEQVESGDVYGRWLP